MKTTKTPRRRTASNGFVLQPGHTTAGCRMMIRLHSLAHLGIIKCGASVSWDGKGVPVCAACLASMAGEKTGDTGNRRVFDVAY